MFSTLKSFGLAVLIMCSATTFANAQEITAIDFSGEVIGKVIPDGKVVSLDNRLIGNINADSLIVNFDGELIGGVVPQGIAIGNDNRFLGKVSSDGNIRVPSGNIVGRALPNGLAVDEFHEVLGAVLFPGLIYSDKGETVGRLIGDGSYVNLQGQRIGFVTADGYAYRQTGNEYILDGKLISSRMVVSSQGEFIGSVSPSGKVSDFDSNLIGTVKSNSFVYDSQNKIIGKVVVSGYAFDTMGTYLGFVTYNGEVINKEELVGKALPSGDIVDLNDETIGFFADFATTYTNTTGDYLGVLLPNGFITKAKIAVGQVAPNGLAVDTEGNVIGFAVNNGPVFDYKGSLIAHALPNGSAVLISGSPLGKVKLSSVYDKTGKIVGSTKKDNIAIDFAGNVLGMASINSHIYKKDGDVIVSPFGYVLSSEGKLLGSSLNMNSLYDIMGQKVADISANGISMIQGSPYTGKLTASGIQLDERNRVLAKILDMKYISGNLGEKLGLASSDNNIFDNEKDIIAKYLSDGSLVKSDGDSISFMEKIGQAYNEELVINTRGSLVGYAGANGVVRDFSNYIIGQVIDRGVVVDNNSAFLGEVVGYNSVLDSSCDVIGMMTSKGEVRNYRDIYIGRPLLNGQIISDSGAIIGYSPIVSGVIDSSSHVLGISGLDGNVVNFNSENLGCLDNRNVLYGNDKNRLGKVVTADTAVSFTGKILGRSTLFGQIYDNAYKNIGYVEYNDSVSSNTGVPLGNLFKYKYAFNNNNEMIGIVLSDTTVFSFKSKSAIGKVDFYGNLTLGKEEIGYALYDLYVYDNAYKAVGYIGVDGNVMSFLGQSFGKMDKGFVVDNQGKVVARGSRDYLVRGDTYDSIGELKLDGDLVDFDNKIIGKLDIADGRILGVKSDYIASAHYLQYYGKIQSTTPVYSERGDVVGYANNDGSVIDENGKIIALLDENGLAVNANGDIIGGIGENWYERAKEVRSNKGEIPKMGVIDQNVKDKAKKSLRIALTPDGEFLGYIHGDNRVITENGKLVGRLMPDGLIIDDNGGLIGIEETSKGGGDMYVPTGTFGKGGAYGTGKGVSNLGPGGGFGSGERYDPQRAAALGAAQSQRRGSIEVGKISTNVKRSSFDGMQENWDEQGIGKAISSWRVDMSEMILADKPIPAVIARSIDSNNPTPVTAYVERNIYAEEGRNIIIPAGSRVIGTLGGLTASSETTTQSAKVQITWERLIRPDGSIFVFQGLTGDAQGRGGALGYLDQQLFKKYTLPVMTTVLTSATTYAMATDKDRNASNDKETSRQQAASDARENFLQSMNSIFEQILQDKVNIRPLTYVPAGTRIIIYPSVDLWLRTLEREENEAASGINVKDVLIDDVETKQSRDNEELKRKNQGRAAGASDAEVVYQYDDEVYEEPSLISDKKIAQEQAKKRKEAAAKKGAGAGTPPPPPPSSSTPLTSSASSKPKPPTSSSGSNSSVPQLF